MTAPNISIGDTVVHVERFTWGGSSREILRTKIVRETPTQWIDDRGDRWRKADGSRVHPCYGCLPRFIMQEAEFEAKAGAK